MVHRAARIWLVELVSVSRLLAALVFASLAFQNVPVGVLAAIYSFAMVSDVVDGYLARRLEAVTYFGKVVDLISDKSMTIVSLLYAAARGIDTLPLALIAIREIVMLGARLIVVGGAPLFRSSRAVGGVMAVLLWGNTFFLVLARASDELIKLANAVYWVCAGIVSVNLIARVYGAAQRIKVSLTQDQ